MAAIGDTLGCQMRAPRVVQVPQRIKFVDITEQMKKVKHQNQKGA
ncbi:hypothetical protein SBF1_1260025 [Candidatus Desulfosporosinus infrequens]|uniref:Uncharacterized protein n=1 Tax=Candidatus Desulfosporosinus infrequens TaxID=2043169 RepID=A0A2U3K2G8_9FIRM|nr:hypothetical protein SBF1_1260025 [Candidatus Desulfosporosinus infrequens]